MLPKTDSDILKRWEPIKSARVCIDSVHVEL